MTDSSISILNRSITSQEYDTSLFEKFTFQSVITKLEKPVGKGCPVYIMNKSTGQIVYKTETDEKSTIYVPNLRKYNKYLVIATDIQDVYNTVAFDINWDFSQDAAYNYSLDYYDMSNLDNIQSVLEYLHPTKTDDSDIISSYSIPLMSDDNGLTWSSSGNPRRDTIKGIPGFYFNGASNVYLPKGVFYQKLPFTFEAYFKILETTDTNQYLLHQTFNNKSYTLHIDTSMNLVFSRPDIVVGLSSITMMSNTNLTLNKDYHVALCFDGSIFYLFLNGVLQTTLEDANGLPYLNTPTIIGYQCKAIIANPVFTKSCKYTTDFSTLFIPFSYNPVVYNNSSDAFAKYVTLLIKNNKITNQVMIEDQAKNIRFDNNLNEVGKNYFNISSTYTSTITSYTALPLGTKDFCLEMSFKVMYTTGNNPTLASNASSSSNWTTNVWALLFNSSSTPNKYSFSSYGTTPWSSNYPSILREQIDIAFVRENTKLRLYVNGFLDSEFTIASSFNFDTNVSSFFSFGKEIVLNLYDLKLTLGNCRYTENYTPKLIEIADKDILDLQYQYVYLPFKNTTLDFTSPLNISTKDINLTSLESINGTKSAYFNGVSSFLLLDNWYTSQEKFSIEMFVKPLEKASPMTLFSMYSSSELINIGISDNKLSYFSNNVWTELDFEFNLEKFNHVVFKRDKSVLKILAEGSLIQSIVILEKLGTPLKTSIGSSQANSNFFNGYINNLYIYKNYFKYEDSYTVPVEEIVINPGEDIEPVVVVNEFTSSALDFENGLTDKIATTIWNKEGIADITTSNVIYGDTSFETKALGDSLYTNSNILTGGSTPFTIEFYALIKDKYGPTEYDAPLISQSKSVASGEQQLNWGRTIRNVYFYKSDNNTPNLSPVVGKYKFNYNEINKYTLTYDSSALRVFINDKLDSVNGTLYGWNKTDNPIRLLDSLVPTFESFRHGTKGIIDNINIHDGIATKVRDYDPYEEFLVVDLAFDGENNSTNIIDNGTLGLSWTAIGNAKLSTTQPFDGYSSLKISDLNSYVKSENNILNFNTDDSYTIKFDFIINNDTYYHIFLANYASIQEDVSMIFYNPTTKSISIRALNSVSSADQFQLTKIIYPNILYNFTMVYNKGLYSFYINNQLNLNVVSQKKFDFTKSGTVIGRYYSSSATIFLDGYIKNFKIYKGIAIIPESTVGKIQLDFDNNVIDKYNNSTWTSNGVTFDQVNSVKGYSAKFDDYNDYLETNSDLINYGSSNFQIDFDLNHNYTGNQGGIVLSNDVTANQNNSFYYFLGGGNSNTGGFGLSQNISNISGYDTTLLKNVWYSNKTIKYNSTVFNYKNGVLVQSINIPNSFNSGAVRLGKPRTSFGNYDGLIGYLDNFKSYKENFSVNYQKFSNNNNITITTNNSLNVYDNSSSGSWIYIVPDDTFKIKNCIIEYDQFFQDKYKTLLGPIFRTYTFSNTNDSFGYHLSFLNTSNTYVLQFGRGSETSIFTSLYTKEIPNELFGRINSIKLIANENTFSFFINDVAFGTITDDYYTSEGFFGWRCYFHKYYSKPYGSGISNFKISDLNGKQLYFKDWKSSIQTIVNKPAVYLPLETTTLNAGYSSLTINSVGNPTYVTLDYDKYIKFENGKYLIINPDNIFNVGQGSDFVLSFNLVLPQFNQTNHTMLLGNGTNYSTSTGFYMSVSPVAEGLTGSRLVFHSRSNGTEYQMRSTTPMSLNTKSTIKITRKNGVVSMYLNEKLENTKIFENINLSDNNLYLGKYLDFPQYNFYMSNFKLFVGTSEIPETYDDKEVLDLDFKPTRESYLFKDNNSKCVIHPVNITQRDYQDSQYCCAFNGTNQYLQLGKNDLLNFGYDDFVINIKFKSDLSKPFNMLLSGKHNGDSSSYRAYLGICGINHPTSAYRQKLTFDISGTQQIELLSNTKIEPNIIYDITLRSVDRKITMIINSVEEEVSVVPEYPVNFNFNNSTTIGVENGINFSDSSNYFKGTIYSVKILRNTSDLSVLQNK